MIVDLPFCAYNQARDFPVLLVTDGSFMSSPSFVNPSLTYMAFTGRACDYAAKQLTAARCNGPKRGR